MCRVDVIIVVTHELFLGLCGRVHPAWQTLAQTHSCLEVLSGLQICGSSTDGDTEGFAGNLDFVEVLGIESIIRWTVCASSDLSGSQSSVLHAGSLLCSLYGSWVHLDSVGTPLVDYPLPFMQGGCSTRNWIERECGAAYGSQC
jgi:hypothetical protein